MSRTRRIAGASAGLVAVSAFTVLYLTAMRLDSVYVFAENYLSDLGVREGAWAFNSGVIIAGALFVVMDIFAVLPALGNGRAERASVALLLVAASFLMSIGIFTEDAGDLHGFVSYGFFLTMIVALGVLSYALYGGGTLGRPALSATWAAFLFGVILMPFGGTPMVETLAVLAILVWGLVMSLLLLRHGLHEAPA